MVKIITAEKAKTIDSVLNNEPDIRVLKAFNQIGDILYFYQPEKKKLDNLDRIAKKNLPGYDRHTLSFLCIEKELFNKYLDSDDDYDCIGIPNPKVDLFQNKNHEYYIKKGYVDIFKDDPYFVKMVLERARDHEGMLVLEIDTDKVNHNSLYIPFFTQKKLKNDFEVSNDIELIEKVGYPVEDVENPEIGSRTKSMLSYSKFQAEKGERISFIRMNKNCYIIEKGKVVYNVKSDSFLKLI